MRTVQKVFSVVIDNGHYTEKHCTSWASPYMCFALDKAYANGSITKKEREKGKCVIAAYIQALMKNSASTDRISALDDALCSVGLPFGHNEKLKIYQNWEQRPFPTLK